MALGFRDMEYDLVMSPTGSHIRTLTQTVGNGEFSRRTLSGREKLHIHRSNPARDQCLDLRPAKPFNNRAQQ
jgi:hypothetical protein